MLPKIKPIPILLWILVSLQQAYSSSDSSSAHQPDVTAYAFVTKSFKDEANGNSLPNKPKDNGNKVPSSFSSLVSSSSLLYDGGCVVSAQAIMCSGGDTSYDEFVSLMNFGGDEYDDEDQSDDEDDDDDGHSSMLSNAALSRAKVGAQYYPTSQRQTHQPQSTSTHESGAMVAKAPAWSKFHPGNIALTSLSAAIIRNRKFLMGNSHIIPQEAFAFHWGHWLPTAK